MAKYTLVSRNELANIGYNPSNNQTYNAIGRNAGNTTNNGSNDNFITKKIKSAENAIGTTAASIVSPINNEIHNAEMGNMLQEMRDRRQSVAKKYGYADIDALYNALDEAEANGDTETANRLLQAEQEDRALTSDSANKIKKSANEFNDYLENSWVSKKIDQDRGKFAGSAINTLSTATDILGLTSGPVSNAIQGGIEGVADELEQNGLENFSWERAGQNAAIGAASGAASGLVNKGVSSRLAKNGGNLFKGSNKLTRGINNLGSSTAAGRIGSTLATGAGRGAIAGAAGGAAGGAVGAGLNGQNILGGAAQGALQGARQGAVAGTTLAGANMIANKTPGVGTFLRNTNQAADDWRNSGTNFKERLYNTVDNNDTWGTRFVGNRIDDARAVRQGFQNVGEGIGVLADRVNNSPLRNIGGTIEVLDDQTPGVLSEADYTDQYALRRSYRPEDTRWKGNPMAKTAEQELSDIAQRNATKLSEMDSTNDISWDIGDDINRGVKSAYYSSDPLYDYLYDIAKRQGVKTETYDAEGYGNNDAVEIDYSALTPQQRAEIARLAHNSGMLRDGYETPLLEDESAISANQLRLIDQTKRMSVPVNDTSENGPIPVSMRDRNTVETTKTETPETQVYRTIMGETETPKTTTSELMYGESELGNRTKRGMLADSLERFGNTLEGAQANVGKAAERDMGIRSTGQVIENVRKKTGLTNLETQARLAKELTGGENSLMDNVQRRALTASENGKPYIVDTTDVVKDVDRIVDKYADTNMFGSISARDKFIRNLKTDISNYDSDVLSISNRMKANAADLRGKGIVDPKPLDSAKAKIYTEVANELDDLSYKSIPQENVEAMFDATISEMRGRATQASNNGNKDVAKAYNMLADKLDAEPRTVKAYRSFKKDFVDISKIDELSARAENGAAAQMGRSFGTNLKRLGNVLLQRPTNAILAKTGGAVNSIADKIGEGATVETTTPGASAPDTTTTPAATTNAEYNPSTQLYDIIGRNVGRDEGEKVAGNYIEQAAQAMGAVTVGSTGNSSTALYNSIMGNAGTNTATNASTASGTSANTVSTPADYYTNILATALNLAAEANDVAAFGTLYEMYNEALANQSSTKDMSDPTNWSSADRKEYLKAQNGLDQIDSLEQSYYNAVGEGGGNVVQGNLRSFANSISGGNLDPSAENYVKQANSIGAGIIKNLVNLGSTEYDAERYIDYLPKLTDTKEQAAQKLQILRKAYEDVIKNLRTINGA